MKHSYFAALVALIATPTLAVEMNDEMTQYAKGQMQAVASNPAVIAAIHARNAQTAGLSEDAVIALDQTWRAEVEGTDRPMITEILANPVSVFLSDLVAQSNGAITEVFVMDARGLNVGQSAITSDYWQGDEAKFTETYPKGGAAVHVSEIELDQSTQTYQGQVSMSIMDPLSGDTIGAVTFGINASSFF